MGIVIALRNHSPFFYIPFHSTSFSIHPFLKKITETDGSVLDRDFAGHRHDDDDDGVWFLRQWKNYLPITTIILLEYTIEVLNGIYFTVINLEQCRCL